MIFSGQIMKDEDHEDHARRLKKHQTRTFTELQAIKDNKRNGIDTSLRKVTSPCSTLFVVIVVALNKLSIFNSVRFLHDKRHRADLNA